MSQTNGRRRLGQYYKSGDWSDYWRTSVSYVGPHKLLIRGYPIEEIVAQLTFAETLYLTVKGEVPTPAQARVLEAALSSIPAHQWVASHLLAAAVTASAFPESPIPGIASGILTMGSVTVSPQEGAALIRRGLAIMDREGIGVDEVGGRLVDEYAGEGRLIPGLGHPNHKDYDPRAKALEQVAREHGVWGPGCDVIIAVRDALAAKTGRDLPINIDGMLACVLGELGFTPHQMAGIAAVAAMPGIIAHVIEELEDGVPLRIVPDELGSVYVGPPERHLGR